MTSWNKLIRFFIWLCIYTQLLFSQQDFSLGEFTLVKIIDGDTFRFEELDKSARLLGIDTEETIKDADAELKSNDLRKNWLDYYYSVKDSSGKPVKIESPFGYDTWQWTKSVFKDVVKIRLEIDEPKRMIDIYGRYLVYVIAVRSDGSEFNYNIECVKQGYSPYFSKYGYSKRFHQQFRDAQNYARENKLGIWSGKENCYPDYEERISWWDERAEQIKYYEENYSGKGNYFSMLIPEDYDNLSKMTGDTVIIFGNVAKVFNTKQPWIARLEAGDKRSFDLVFFEKDNHILSSTGIDSPKDYYFYAKGKLTEYKGRPQIIIEDPSQIWR
ncbi:MAG: thermonuclease family protein [Ignavibacteria bacterium]|nr:thermonuclease family protein [Ignavibacteria bacterium]